jgi:hypothetical protein
VPNEKLTGALSLARVLLPNVQAHRPDRDSSRDNDKPSEQHKTNQMAGSV